MKRKRKTKGAKKLTFFIVAILICVFAYTSFFGVDNYYGIREQFTQKASKTLLGALIFEVVLKLYLNPI